MSKVSLQLIGVILLVGLFITIPFIDIVTSGIIGREVTCMSWVYSIPGPGCYQLPPGYHATTANPSGEIEQKLRNFELVADMGGSLVLFTGMLSWTAIFWYIAWRIKKLGKSTE
jgi:hypothetical protein